MSSAAPETFQPIKHRLSPRSPCISHSTLPFTAVRIYRERIRQLESVSNQTPLFKNENSFVLCRVVEGSLDTLKTNPIEFCAVVLGIQNKGRWLGKAMFITFVCKALSPPTLDWLITHGAISIEESLAYCQDTLNSRNWVVKEGQSFA